MQEECSRELVSSAVPEGLKRAGGTFSGTKRGKRRVRVFRKRRVECRASLFLVSALIKVRLAPIFGQPQPAHHTCTMLAQLQRPPRFLMLERLQDLRLDCMHIGTCGHAGRACHRSLSLDATLG